MNPKFLRTIPVMGALLLIGAVALSGCSKPGTGLLFPNQPPSVELTNAPASADSTQPYFYAYKVNWSGYDPDGRVDHYDFAVDPTNTDTVWVTTKKNEEIVFFRASRPDSVLGNNPPTASDFHVFVIRAVDDKGAMSARKNRAFFSYTIAPTVQILNPIPSQFLRAQVPPSVRIDWTGTDVDGQFSQKPVKYKFKNFDLDDPIIQSFLPIPDALRKREAATNWAGWDSTSADTQFVQFTNLTPGKSYLFVLIGFDEAGAYSPVFTLNSNMLQYSATLAASNGPLIHIFNQYIDFTYQNGGYSTDPLREIPIEIPSNHPVPHPVDVNWEAFPPQGSRIQAFRWMVDGNINDQTPRSDELNDYIHWSQPSPTMPNSVRLRGFDDGVHRFYLECADNNGQKSLGILKMTAVTPTFDKELLVLDDTRLEVDKIGATGCPNTYTKPWPSRAEFDTFMFARGNVPWRCTKNPTTGVTSTPGLFAGYSFDTLGTRLGLENPANGVLLSRIGNYKNLIWLVDSDGAGYTEDLPQTTFPVTALYAMSGPGRASSLAAYTQLGGRVWMAGGGAAFASLHQFDKRGNNSGQTTLFTSQTQFGELAPSRIMFDGAHWQSTIAITKGSVNTFRYEFDVNTLSGTDTIATHYIVAPPWKHYSTYLKDTLSSPNYSKLPPEMRWRSPATDPMPPTRLSTQTGLFYPTSYPSEYLLDPNGIIEDVDPDPEVSHEVSVLDTLYESQSVILLTNGRAPTMTYYHGTQANRFVFTGFAPWGYARQDCLGLVDFVLQDLWGLQRQPIDRGSIAPSIPNGVSRPARIVTPAQRTVSARVPTGTTRE